MRWALSGQPGILDLTGEVFSRDANQNRNLGRWHVGGIFVVLIAWETWVYWICVFLVGTSRGLEIPNGAVCFQVGRLAIRKASHGREVDAGRWMQISQAEGSWRCLYRNQSVAGGMASWSSKLRSYSLFHFISFKPQNWLNQHLHGHEMAVDGRCFQGFSVKRYTFGMNPSETWGMENNSCLKKKMNSHSTSIFCIKQVQHHIIMAAANINGHSMDWMTWCRPSQMLNFVLLA